MTAAKQKFKEGLALLERGAADEGLEALHGALALDPHFIPGYLALADITRTAGRGDVAEEVLMAGIVNNPDSPELLLPGAEALASRGRLAEALELAEEAARRAPDDRTTLGRLAALRLANGDLPGAERAAVRRMELAPRDADACFELGVVYEAAGLIDRAKAAYKQALVADPKSWKALANLGEIQAVEPGFAGQEGLNLLEHAAKLAPKDVLEPRWNLALARWRRGDRKGARRAAEEVARSVAGSEGLRAEARRFLAAIEREGA